jgi:predicted transcriptional regulator
MVLADERILEYISEEGSGAPTEMSESGLVRYTPQHISQRCSKLADHGLLQPLGNGVYIITDEGEAYLEEEYDAEAGRYIDRDAADSEDEAPGSAEDANHG